MDNQLEVPSDAHASGKPSFVISPTRSGRRLHLELSFNLLDQDTEDV